MGYSVNTSDIGRIFDTGVKGVKADKLAILEDNSALVAADTEGMKEVVVSDGRVIFTDTAAAQNAKVKSFNDTMGIGEQEKDEEKLKQAGDRMSEDDAAGFCDEGLSVKEYLGEQLEKALDRVKLEIKIKQEYCREEGENLRENREDIERMAFFGRSLSDREKDIARRLQEIDLPVTEELIAQIIHAGSLVAAAGKLTDSAKAGLIAANAPVTLDRMIRAPYIGGPAPKKLDKETFDELVPQIEKELARTLEQTGIKADIEDARWLLERELPVNPQSLSLKKGLDGLEITNDKVADAAITAIDEGKQPMDGILVEPAEYSENIGNVEEAGGRQITSKELSGIFTVHRMEKSMEAVDAYSGEESASEADRESTYEVSRSSIDLVIRGRKLEEAKLLLVKRDGGRSEKLLGNDREGLIRDMEERIDRLKNIEKKYYSLCLEEVGASAEQESISKLSTIVELFEELKTVPAYTLADTFERRNEINPQELAQSGNSLKASFEAMGRSYEAVGTQIRSDLGDSIAKAFANVDEVLQMNSYELTEANRRAVRILSFNHMDVNDENMAGIKSYDRLVNDLLETMKPVVAAELVRRGVDALHMPVTQLTDLAKQIAKEKGSDSKEKFSEYLVRLDRMHGITETEREAYIGIYRLFKRIEKDSGAVIGDCYNRGVELTLENLLSADRTRRHGHVDTRVNDEFGVLEDVVSAGVSITEQILACIKPENINLEEAMKETPEKLLEQLAADRDLSVETERTLLDLHSAANAPFETEFLHDFEEPASIGSILAMQELAGAPELIRKLEKESEQAGLQTEPFEGLKPEELGDAELVRDRAKQLLDEAANRIEELTFENDAITSADALRLERLGAHVTLLRAFARREYYELPVETESGAVQMNLTVIRSGEDRGRIEMKLRGERPVTVSMKVDGGRLEGLVAASDSEAAKLLRRGVADLTEKLKAEGLKDIRLYVVSESRSERSYLEGIARTMKGAGGEQATTTGMLYRVARAFAEELVKIS